MRRLVAIVFAITALAVAAAAPVGAQTFGQFTPVAPYPSGTGPLGVYLVFGDRVDDVGLLGQYRFETSKSFNWGLQFGFADGPGDGAVLLGGDIRPILKRADADFPLDLAFDAGVGLTLGDEVTVFEITPVLQVSHGFQLEGGGGTMSPYGSVGLDVQNVDYDSPANDDSDTEVDVIGRFGLEWLATPKFGIIAELQFGNGTSFATGVNVLF